MYFSYFSLRTCDNGNGGDEGGHRIARNATRF